MDVIVLGGYGRAGELCVRELVQTTSAHVVIGGRNAQTAERAALAHGERAAGLYLDARDARTLHEPFAGAAAVLCCSAGAPFAALESALEVGTPFVCLTPFHLDARARAGIAVRAWKAKVPIVLGAGAVPGLPGVVAEWFVREFRALDELRIACSGPWTGTASARTDLEALHQKWKPRLERGRARSRWSFPEPIGRRVVRPSQTLDLEGFAAAHCLERLTYLEAGDGIVARAVQRLLDREQTSALAIEAEAYGSADAREPSARLSLFAPDTLRAAAASAGVLVRAILSGAVAPGLLSPREAVNPGAFLHALPRPIQISHKPATRQDEVQGRSTSRARPD